MKMMSLKKMSFENVLVVFGGFLLVALLVAIIAVEATHPGTPKIVTTQIYHRDPNAAQPARDPGSTAVAAVSARNTVQQPAPIPPIGRRAVDTPEAAAGSTVMDPVESPAAPAVPPTDVGPHLIAIDGKLDDLTARLSALDVKKAPMPAAAQRPSAHRSARAPVKPVLEEEPREQVLPELPGYKSMAVVSTRAWVRTPEGFEESVVQGERLPSPRVRAIHTDTGVIITSTDQRIEAH